MKQDVLLPPMPAGSEMQALRNHVGLLHMAVKEFIEAKELPSSFAQKITQLERKLESLVELWKVGEIRHKAERAEQDILTQNVNRLHAKLNDLERAINRHEANHD